MKDFKIYIGIASILLIIYLVAEYNKPAPVNWKSSLSYQDKIPFGTYLLYHQLNRLFPAASVVQTNKSATQTFKQIGNGSYIIIAGTANMSKTDYEAMVKFIERGNDVFISAFNFNAKLADTLKLETSAEYRDTSTALNFTSPSVKFSHPVRFDHDMSNQYFLRFDTTKAVVLGQNQFGHSNYLCYKFGKGKLLLLANPHLLSNYSLLQLKGSKYAETALSYLSAPPTVYWDLYQNHEVVIDESPLRVIFAHDGLRWAYYVSLISLLIFSIYETKRRQRVIPVIEPLANATVDFVKMVGKIYYEQRDNKNISNKLITYFAESLRNDYQLKLAPADALFREQMARKTGVDESLVQELLNFISRIASQNKVSDHDLIKLNQLIQNFYALT